MTSSHADSVLISTAPSPYPFEFLSRADNFAAGIVSGILARTLSCPFDVIKIIAQVDTQNRTWGQSISALYRERGFKAFWTGNTTAIMNQGYYSGIKFFAIKELRQLVGKRAEKSGAESALIGAVAGVIAQAALYPMDFLRTRMIVYPDKYRSFWQSAATVFREEGFTALWTGLTPTVVGSIPYEGSNYLVYDAFREIYIRNWHVTHITPAANAVMGTAAGMVSQAVAYPFEMVRRKMMLTNSDGKRLYESMTECFIDTYQKEGMGGFFKGLGWNTLKVIPFSALQYTLYDETCKVFRALRMFNPRRK